MYFKIDPWICWFCEISPKTGLTQPVLDNHNKYHIRKEDDD